ncbi:hypothetical protein WA556_001522 [Blastocystis sp. ATCC 50177/Nand II]
MVIDEPKTPYVRLGMTEDAEKEEQDHRQDLLDRLLAYQSSLQNKEKETEEETKDEDSEAKRLEESERKHEEFLKKRKLFYREYQDALHLKSKEEEE